MPPPARPAIVLPAMVFIVAVGIRLVVLARGGGFSALGPYDDAVHFAAALNLAGGVLPYRDFLFVHPPGIMVLLTPWALAATALGEPLAFDGARVTWVLLGGVNATLCWAALRPYGRLAAAAAGFGYATFVPAIRVEVTTMLEAPANTVLLSAIVLTGLLSPSPTPLSRGRAITAGVLLGISPALKVWGLPIVLLVIAGVGWRLGRRDALRIAVGAAASCTAVCLPFFLAAPTSMWTMVVGDQLNRPRTVIRPLVQRVNEMEGLWFWVSSDITRVHLATVGILIATALALAVCLTRPSLRPLAAVTIGAVAVAIASPTWFGHYAALTSVPLILSWCAAAASVGDMLPRSRTVPRSAIPMVTILGLAVLAAPLARGDAHYDDASFPGPWARAVVASRPGCVTSDQPVALIDMNVVRRNNERGCRPDIDLTGMQLHYRDADPAAVNARWQGYLLDYLRSGDSALMVRFRKPGRVVLTDTYQTINRWPTVSRLDGFSIRSPNPPSKR